MLDSLGHPPGAITKGEPTDSVFYTVLPSEVHVFNDKKSAEKYLCEELEKMKKADPMRWARILRGRDATLLKEVTT